MTYIARAELAAADDDGTVLLNLPGNPTMRVLRTGLAATLTGAGHDAPLLGGITDLYFDGDMHASVANTGQVSSRITDLLPASQIVQRTWTEIEAASRAAATRAG